MWCSDRRAFLAGLAAFALTGCRFTPVYGPGGAGRALMGAVRADDPVSRADYQFVAALEERLGRPVRAGYALSYRIGQSELETGVVRSLGPTRIQLSGTLDFVLTDAATGAQVASGRIVADSAYSTTSNQLTTLTAAEDAELRLMRMLVDGLVTRLMTEPGLRRA
ncbi:LPS assembly lipoprotein LptE [Pararhodobacter sp. SW119]|uniref:LPS assembly lipoprotein LptE n=1 Tax=Pararhodobacter sp. SW119 TaxID=2780075 RepID=UPI001ADF73EA|nr:LPS assembly lipoprotein LptE [Pararhodobacter sp. SW119]